MTGILMGIQLFFSFVIGLYFLLQLKNSTSAKTNINKDSTRKYEELQKLRRIKLTEPLTEKMRPKTEEDIMGQKDGLLALKTALCTPNPQHIIIYGSPGIGKTAAARVALEIAKKQPGSPFRTDAKFIEIDATTLRFDERSVADPLIGSVHDPIYQGAGAYGAAGVPQPKPGAVTKAHGGVLFIDEIGELHPVQMNKLLKVLEDRKVLLESAYYAQDDDNIPRHIHDIFRNGLPADFRLIGATTRSREEIPAALRSRCVEIFFKDLTKEEILEILNRTIMKDQIKIEDEAKELIATYATNGRDAITMLQTAYNKTLLEVKEEINEMDIEWVIKSGGYSKYIPKEVDHKEHIGKVNGLGFIREGLGMLLDIQAVVQKVAKKEGELKITGLIEEEELHRNNSTSKRKSMAYSSAENVLTLFKLMYGVDIENYFIHINFPTGIPVDGPSAGIAMFSCIYSALFNEPISSEIAMTGEITIHGEVYPVGGVTEKIMAAKNAGVKKVIIPKASMQHSYEKLEIEIIPVETIEEVIQAVWNKSITEKAEKMLHA